MKQPRVSQPSISTFAPLGISMTLVVAPLVSAQAAPLHGMVGVGTWATQAEFKDIKVTKAGRTLGASNFVSGLKGWKTSHGKWSVANGVLRQTSGETDARAVFGDPKWSDYTLTLKARKTGGKEGFLVIFDSAGNGAKSWWNVGGWGNTNHAIELPGLPLKQLKGKVVTGRWYNVRVETKGSSVKCYLDNKLVQQKA